METIISLLANLKVYFKKNILVLSIILLSSCNEKEFLKEVPLSFYSPENSYVTFENFESAINNIYYVFRLNFYTTRDQGRPPRATIIGTDLVDFDENATNLPDILVPTSDFVYTAWWKPSYQIIYDANVIIGRSESEIAKLTEEQKIKIQAEARFFRGYMYKILGNIHGGVPIVLEETTEPKRDYVRATLEDVYEQSVSDLKFAAENLPDINEVDDSRISNLAAYHALAEAYLSLKQWDNAISAASTVINNPNMALMTERFGSRVNDKYNPDFPWASGGDVYWDLFRKDNQNRSSGNTEAIWVIQFAFNVPGGSDGGYRWETCSCSRTWMLKIKNIDGTTDNVIPYPNTYYGGRGAGQTRASRYFYYEIWNKSGFDQDIRNAYYNIIRDLKVNNPASDHHGKWIFKDNLIKFKTAADTTRNYYPIIAKIASMGDHPKEIWMPDQTVYGSISSTGGPANTTYRDEYRIRLAETYLVRAEAFLEKGDLENAAKDINVIRNRAQAPEVEPAEVDIDYILDERARELAFEENRLQTLTRLGKLVERNNKYNPMFKYYAHQNLWPIPYSEIEKNTEAVLEQNPGY